MIVLHFEDQTVLKMLMTDYAITPSPNSIGRSYTMRKWDRQKISLWA